MNSTIASSQFETDEFDIWRESISVVFDVERPDGSLRAFCARVEAFQLGDIVLGSADLGAQRYRRSSLQAHRDGMDHFFLNLYRTGGWQAQTTQGDFSGRAGQISILDLARDLVSDEPDSELVTLFVPRSLLEARLPNLGALHGAAPSGPSAALLADFIDLLARQLPALPAGEEQALSHATCEMLVACLAPSLTNLEAARPALELVLRRRARRFIESELGSSELNIDVVCGAIGISRRALYRLFDQDGGVQHYIQNRRLERIKSALADPNETRRISEVAAEFGFHRSDHFARAFKHQFGQSARDLRFHPGGQSRPIPAEVSASTNGPGFDDWIRALHD